MPPIQPPPPATLKKKHSASSARWLRRQLADPYVAEAKRLGYRSRAAFKLIELDDRFRLLKPGTKVVDLGAAPDLLTLLKQRFATVRHAKPPASRAESAEVYVVATGYRPEEAEPDR